MCKICDTCNGEDDQELVRINYDKSYHVCLYCFTYYGEDMRLSSVAMKKQIAKDYMESDAKKTDRYWLVYYAAKRKNN